MRALLAALAASVLLCGCPVSFRVGSAVNTREHYEPLYLAQCVNINVPAQPKCYDKRAALQQLKAAIVAAQKASKIPGSAKLQRRDLRRSVAYTKEVFGNR